MFLHDGFDVTETISFFDDLKNKSLETPFFLIASPNMTDSYFQKTVIYVYEHSEKGTEGLVINAPSQHDQKDFNPYINVSLPMYKGGPVYEEVPVVLLKHQDEIGFKRMNEYIQIIENVEEANFEYLLSEKLTFKIMWGLSQWSSKQLEKEIEARKWLIGEFDVDFMFSYLDKHEIWTKALHRLGSKFKILQNYTTKAYLN